MKIIKMLEDRGCEIDNEIIWELVRLAYGNYYKAIIKKPEFREYLQNQIKVQFGSKRHFCAKTGIKYHQLIHILNYQGKSIIKREIIIICNALQINLKYWI